MHRSFFQCYPRLFVRLYLKYKFNAYCEKSDPKLFPLDSISKCRVFTSLLFFVQNIVIYYVRFSVCPYLHLLLAIISLQNLRTKRRSVIFDGIKQKDSEPVKNPCKSVEYETLKHFQ